MEIDTQIIIAVTLYKVISLVVGLVLAYLGYRLFVAGVWGEAGDVEAHFKDNKLIVKKAAPGTFFALCGAIVIGFTIFKGLQFMDKELTSPNQAVIENMEEAEDVLPDNPPS